MKHELRSNCKMVAEKHALHVADPAFVGYPRLARDMLDSNPPPSFSTAATDKPNGVCVAAITAVITLVTLQVKPVLFGTADTYRPDSPEVQDKC
jgi:hypothetical protein